MSKNAVLSQSFVCFRSRGGLADSQRFVVWFILTVKHACCLGFVLFRTVQHLCKKTSKIAVPYQRSLVPNHEKLGTVQHFCKKTRKSAVLSQIWQNEQKRCTVPIFGAFGHQEASQVPKDGFFWDRTIFSVLDWLSWDSAAFVLVFLQKCFTVPIFSWISLISENPSYVS